jgi:hypothetical protein
MIGTCNRVARLAILMTGMAALTLLPLPALGQSLPNGPFADESAYTAALAEVTSTISGTDTIGVVRSVELVIDDQVDGGCWTNSSAIAARVRAELEKFGIAVYQEPLALRTVFAPVLQISGLGYRSGSAGCVTSATMEVVYWGTTTLGDLGYTGRAFDFENPVLLWSANSVFSNPARVDDQLLKQAQEWVDTLIGDIAKARRTEEVQSVLSTWPSAKALTATQFEELLKEYSQRPQ